MFKVSRIDFSDGETFAIIVVLAFPPNEFLRRRVNLESRYLINIFGFSASWLITSPSVVKLWFIFAASLTCYPSAYVSFNLSDPAKSTMLNYEVLLCLKPSQSVNFVWTVNVKTAWLHDDSLFIDVSAICQFQSPCLINYMISFVVLTSFQVKPST